MMFLLILLMQITIVLLLRRFGDSQRLDTLLVATAFILLDVLGIGLHLHVFAKTL